MSNSDNNVFRIVEQNCKNCKTNCMYAWEDNPTNEQFVLLVILLILMTGACTK